jgi:hypothetical protein
VKAHTNILGTRLGNDEANKLAKQGVDAPHVPNTLFHLIGHQTPYLLSIPPPTSIQHNNPVHNLKIYIGKIIQK